MSHFLLTDLLTGSECHIFAIIKNTAHLWVQRTSEHLFILWTNHTRTMLFQIYAEGQLDHKSKARSCTRWFRQNVQKVCFQNDYFNIWCTFFLFFFCILLIWRIKARRILLFLFVCMSCFSHDHLRNCFNDCEIFHQSRRSRLKTCRNVICKNDKIPTCQRPNSKKKKKREHALKYEHFSKVSKRFIAKLDFRLNGS